MTKQEFIQEIEKLGFECSIGLPTGYEIYSKEETKITFSNKGVMILSPTKFVDIKELDLALKFIMEELEDENNI